jgi:nucleotide-binding universal stress UspA family protein
MKRLLICTDGSNYSQQCCSYGAWLAKESGAAIDVLYVTDIRRFEIPAVADLSGSLGVQPYEGMIAQMQEVEALKAKFVSEQTLDIFKQAGLPNRVQFHHQTGLLVDAIGQLAQEADLILLGKRGENANFATEHLGSMLERVIRTVKKPCLVTPRAYQPVQRLAIAYDGGVSCQQALHFVAAQALFHALEIQVITVVERQDADLATARLLEAEQVLQAAKLKPICQVLNGEVGTAIADYITQAQVDCLIAGAYGHSRIRELIIGSTTTDLMRCCHIPLLCFR